jgi:hypothetical protein
MNLTQKISQMTPKGADLAATDLIEVSTLEAGSYVTKSITGQELIDAIPLPPTGLTVGTTPIASGTIGRVLFEGTGNVLQQSSSLFWDNTNGRLGVNTITPGARLEINGESRFSMACTTKNGAGFFMSDATTGYQPYAGIYTDTAANELFVKSYSNINFGWSTTPGAVMSTRIMTLKSATGNVLINTTTDAGFKLDVNGTARVSGVTTITAGLTVAVSNLPVFNLLDTLTNHTWQLRSNGGSLWFIANGANNVQFRTNGNVLIGTITDAGFKLDVNGTARVKGTGNNSATTTAFKVENSLGTRLMDVRDDGSILFRESPCSILADGTMRNTYLQTTFGALIGAQAYPVASAIFEVQSTTKGFLPPRMTTTQRNAISSPAAGLIVYDTTLNLPHFFNGTIWVSL